MGPCSLRGLVRGWPMLFGLLSTACAVTPPAAPPPIPAPPPMEILRLDSPAGAYAPFALDAKPLAPPTAGSAPRETSASPAPSAGFTHLFGGLDQASRGSVSITAGAWKQRWGILLQPEFGTFGLIASQDRVMVLGRVHELVSSEGKSLYWGLTGLLLPGLFPEEGVWLSIDADGTLQRRRLGDAGLEFQSPAFGGDSFLYSLVALHQQNYVIAGSERRLDPHGGHQPSRSEVQHLKITPPYEVDPTDQLLLDAGGGERLRFPSTLLLGLARGERLTFLSQNLLLESDFALGRRAAYTGEFTPVAASLDESGGTHLLVKTSRGLRYWALSPAGARDRDVALEGAIPERIVPPVLGYDRRVFIQLAGRLLILGADGGQQASLPLRNPHARVLAQPDGSVLVADGDSLWLLGQDLQAVRLLRLEGETLRAPAVAVSAHRLYLATESSLYCFER